MFLDTRDFAEEVAFHVFPYQEVCVEEIVGLLEVAVPARQTAMTSGTDGPADREGYHKISQGLLITLWVESDQPEDASAEDGESSGQADDEMEHSELSLQAGRFFHLPELTAAVYLLQNRTAYVQASLTMDDSAAAFVHALEGALFEGDPCRFLCEVQPQPETSFVVVVMATTWSRLLGLIPILIDARDVGGHLFAAYTGHEFCRDDIAARMGHDWSEDFVVHAPAANATITGDQRYPSLNGMLVIVLRADGALPELLDPELRKGAPAAAR